MLAPLLLHAFLALPAAAPADTPAKPAAPPAKSKQVTLSIPDMT